MYVPKNPRSIVLKAALATTAVFIVACGGFFAYVSVTDASPGLLGGEACCCPDC